MATFYLQFLLKSILAQVKTIDEYTPHILAFMGNSEHKQTVVTHTGGKNGAMFKISVCVMLHVLII